MCSRSAAAQSTQLETKRWVFGTKVLYHFFARDFCAHSVIMTDHASSLCRISSKTEMKPVHIVPGFLRRAESNLSIFEDVGAEGFSPVAFYLLSQTECLITKKAYHPVYLLITPGLPHAACPSPQCEPGRQTTVGLCSEPCVWKWQALL